MRILSNTEIDYLKNNLSSEDYNRFNKAIGEFATFDGTSDEFKEQVKKADLGDYASAFFDIDNIVDYFDNKKSVKDFVNDFNDYWKYMNDTYDVSITEMYEDKETNLEI